MLVNRTLLEFQTHAKVIDVKLNVRWQLELEKHSALPNIENYTDFFRIQP